MLWAAVAHALGIVTGVYLWRPVLWWVVAGWAFVGFAAYFVRRRSGLGWILALAAFFLAGAFHIQVRGSAVRFDTGIQSFADREELQVVAHVTRDGHWQSGSFHEMKQTLYV